MIRNEGIPTEPGFYWCEVASTQYTMASVDVVEVRLAIDGTLYVSNGSGAEPNEFSQVWQRVKPYEEEQP